MAPGVIVLVLLGVGLYFPTSQQGDISKFLEWGFFSLTCALFACLLLRKNGILSPRSLVLGCAINAILLACTLFSPLHDFAYGAFAPYLLISMVVCLNLQGAEAGGRAVQRAFAAVNALNLAGIALLLAGEPHFQALILDCYAAHYTELVPAMLRSGRPVLTFGSHTFAAFFFFLFFYLNFRTYMAARSRLSLLAALAYLAACTRLQSVSGYLLAILGMVCMAVYFSRVHPLWGAAFAAASILLVAYGGPLSPAVRAVTASLNEPANGFRARYTPAGPLAPTLQFIADHPMFPIGYGYSQDLWYGDSGPVDLLLRGSVPLLLAVYSAFWLFLAGNLRSRRTAYTVFAIYMMFEIGMGNLAYFRTTAVLPFVVVYLNSLEARQRVWQPGAARVAAYA